VSNAFASKVMGKDNDLNDLDSSKKNVGGFGQFHKGWIAHFFLFLPLDLTNEKSELIDSNTYGNH
jgi:hypothetical protein